MGRGSTVVAVAPNHRGLVLAGLLLAMLTLPAAARAASSLWAWRISREGSLELRTAPGTGVQAFFQEGAGSRGPRIWFDLPGAPSRARSLWVGDGLREVRIGKPDDATTRLVLEFQPGIRLDPSRLRLVGTARDRWRMELPSSATRSSSGAGEGTFDSPLAIAVVQQHLPQRPRLALASAMPLPSLPAGSYRVVIDPGHGGPDPGAIGIQGLRETDVVLDVSLQVAQILQRRGVQVLLTRTSEVDVDLPPRVALANASGASLFVSLHANALSLDRPDVNGIETFFFESGRSSDLAQILQDRLLAVSPGTPDRGARPGRFYVIRRTVMPSVLAEMGFVTGEIDAPRLSDASFRRRLAHAISGAILTYLRQAS